MSTKGVRSKSILKRDALIVECIAQKMSRPDICDTAGIEIGYLIMLARKHGWTLPTTRRGQTTTRQMPIGMDAESARMRGRLGGIVADLIDKKTNPVELAMLTGVTQTQLNMTKERPFNHNWSISQLQRLAKYLGKDFNTFMQELTKP